MTPLRRRCPPRPRRAFSLLELVIAVAILLVLAAIAAPNFLDAQTRAKVTRAQADLRTLAIAIEAYHADWNDYPLNGELHTDGTLEDPQIEALKPPAHKFPHAGLTTPVAYLTTLPDDPFLAIGAPPFPDAERPWRLMFYTNLTWFRRLREPAPPPVIDAKIRTWGPWVAASAGPDLDRLDLAHDLVYDPTNGTVSDGDLIRGATRW